MLVLARNAGERIVIDGDIVVSITKVKDGRVWVGIDAPRHIAVHREEVQLKVLTEGSKRDVGANKD